MNQHKDLLYRQKYATYQLNNRTFSTQNTKISARSLAISYICFQVRIVKNKIKKNILSTTTENLVTPAPPTRDKALYAKLQREKLQFLSLLTTILKALICWKLESFRGLRPLGPRQGPLDPTRMRCVRCASRTHGALHARIPLFFGNPGSATVHIPPCPPPPPPLTRYARYATDRGSNRIQHLMQHECWH